MADPEKPNEIKQSDRQYRFANPTYEVISDAEARIEKAFPRNTKGLPRKELSDRTAPLDENSLKGLISSREIDNRESLETACYSTIGSVMALGAALIHRVGYDNLDLVGTNTSASERFVDTAIQMAASPIPIVIYYCMLTLAAITVCRAVGARMGANHTDNKLLEMEESYRKNNKNYKRLISS